MRPKLHFTAERGWINDPHGITFHDGRYHVFYQYVPDSLVWAPNCHWGHATGVDLFSLSNQSVALAPGDGDDGIWTGSLVTGPSGEATIFYTSTLKRDLGDGRIRTATPTDPSWQSWRKHPVLITAPDGEDLVGFRDPFLFRDAEGWRMLVGSGTRDGIAAAQSYTSPDLQNWTYQGVAVSRPSAETQPVWMGALWECPQLFELDGRHVLVTSVWDDDVLYYAGYGIGSFSDGKFVAETWGRLTFGPSYYAPSFFRDAAGRACLTFWMRGVSDAEAGWASAHSIPYVLSLSGDRLVAAPHPDLENALDRLAGDTTNVVSVSWTPDLSGELRIAGDGEELALIRVDPTTLSIQSSDVNASCPRSPGAPIRVLVDGPTLEVIVDGVLVGGAIPPASTLTMVASDPDSLGVLIPAR